MPSTLTPATHRASFAIGGEQAAKRVVDVLTEILSERQFLEDQAAIAAFERPDGRWEVAVHFAEAPDQALVREIVGDAAGEAIAQDIGFDTVEAKDWVKASLADLVPVPAGRFVVHGQHDRARVPANKLGIEIEAALEVLDAALACTEDLEDPDAERVAQRLEEPGLERLQIRRRGRAHED